MSVVTITLNKKHFQIACNDGEEELLIEAASQLDERITEMREASPNATTELLLIFCALALQDENSDLKDNLQKVKMEPVSEIDNTKMSETLMTIANYLEELAAKVR